MSIKLSEKINTAAGKDILELDKKIHEFKTGKISEDKFKHFRLTRGVYGQRQLGVQMVRIKLPYGKLTINQLQKIADASDRFSTGNLHLTTRQDIQIHYVKLDDSPALWAMLEEEGITLREACGNTVRNVTASATAGIDAAEPFDVTPYAHALADYFLRNPISQDMGRKIKIAFSSSEKDTAYTFFHDLGFIPRLKITGGKEKRGFRVLIGGGLGAQPFLAKPVYEFLEEDLIIPFAESVLRVFDRYGERTRRQKARLKFLINEIGLDEFLNLVEEEKTSIKHKRVVVDRNIFSFPVLPEIGVLQEVSISNEKRYKDWLATNVFEQKQSGFFGVNIRILLGNIHSSIARQLAGIAKKYTADDIRVTVNQGLLLKFISKDVLPVLFIELDKIGLAKPGFYSTHDITACPGSDTCNLAVTNSTALAVELENVLKEEYYDLIFESNLKIKISGCMNSCGQHLAANIGFHGSSIKNGLLVAPAMQIVLGGGIDPEGQGSFADKIIKIPTKKAPVAMRIILNDYEEKSLEGEYFNTYYRRLGKMYFYQLLKPLAQLETLEESDYIDWGNTATYKTSIGVGECAGISLDVVGTVISESQEKLELAKDGLREGFYADSIYNSYSSLVIAAKALLLSADIQCNTQAGIVRDFNVHFVLPGKINPGSDFESLVFQINKNEPSLDFAEEYFAVASLFLQQAKKFRKQQLESGKALEGKLVVDNYYKA